MLVVCVIGCPGSGKSSLCSLLERRYAHGNPVCCVRERVSFDDAEETFSSDKVGWDGTTFARFRSESLLRIAGVLQAHSGGEAAHALLVDDIMYLHSMRRELYALCRDRGCAVVFIHAQVGLEVALARNADRPAGKRVEEEAVRRIHGRFELLDPQLSSERNSVSVDLSAGACLEEGLEACDRCLGAALERCKSAPTSSASVAATVVPLSEASLLDLQLRKLVARFMNRFASLGGGEAPARAELSRALSACKASLLAQGIRPGEDCADSFSALVRAALEGRGLLSGAVDALLAEGCP